jgi:hypothetical protein
LFRGGAGGVAMAHLPGLNLAASTAMGIGAMCAVMLRLPITAVLLATLLFFSDGIEVMPLVIVAVVIAYVASAWLLTEPPAAPPPSEPPPSGPSGSPPSPAV